jgi:hypothetical protein
MQARRRVGHAVNLRAGVCSGVVAGVVSTVAQLALWALFSDALPSILFRDARLAAAIVLGPSALVRPDHDFEVLLVATVVHFALSIAYGVAIGWLLERGPSLPWHVLGAAAGAAIFLVNMFGMTRLWPWFAATRDPITLAAHLVFGVAAETAYRRFARSREPR